MLYVLASPLFVVSRRMTTDHRIGILLRKMRVDEMTKMDSSTPKNKIVIRKFPTIFSNEVTGVPLEQAPGVSSLLSMDDRFVTVIGFSTVEMSEPPVFHTIPRHNSIVFVMAHREAGKRGKISYSQSMSRLHQCLHQRCLRG